MTPAAAAMLAITVVLALTDWVAVACGSRRVEYVVKPGTLAALVVVALLLDPTHDDTRAWFVVALVASLAGDVFLMLPSDRFVPGLASFLAAHVAYVVGLDLHGGSAVALVVAAVPVGAAAIVVARRILRSVLARGERELVAPLVAYMLVIASMATSAVASGNVVAASGAVLFMSSDAMIAEERFVMARRWQPVAIMVTYHLAQIGLVVSLVR